MDDAKPPSLFLVLSYGSRTPYSISILQLETPAAIRQGGYLPQKQIQRQDVEFVVSPRRFKPDDGDFTPEEEHEALLMPEQIEWIRVNKLDDDYTVARFREPIGGKLLRWLFSPPTVSTEDLYLLPNDNPSWCRGYKFNFRTGECRPIKPPRAPKYLGHVSRRRGGHIYFMAHPDWYYDTPDPVFECYDPYRNKWKALEPFPDHAVHLHRCSIKATAVLDDTILYNMGGCRIWAYYVPKDKWYIVDVDDARCYRIVGEAVVLQNTIYALTNPYYYCDLVLALSIRREKIDGDHVFKCSLLSQIWAPGIDEIKYMKTNAFRETRHLVHLGRDYFCLVHSCNPSNSFRVNIYQPIQLTYLKLIGQKFMTVTNIRVYEVEIQPEYRFEVGLCFSLPECKTTALKEGQRFVYNLNPCRDHSAAYASKQEHKTDFNPEPEVGKPVQASTHGDGAAYEKSNSAKEGYSIYLRNLPPDATFGKLENELKKFGSIKWNGIRVIIDNTGDCCFAACVVFESATSKRDAIEASSIMIEGCRVEIEEKREDSASLYIPCCRQGDAAYVSKQKDETDNNLEAEVGKPVQASTQGDGAASENSITAEEGHYIYVRNLPQDATIRQLENELKKFGSIKWNGIRFIMDEPGSCPSAVRVEFESASSKQDAIKASSIMIHGHQAVIEGKREDSASQYILCCRQGDAADMSKQKDKTDFSPKPEVGKPVQASTNGHGTASERSNTAECHCICVTNLPPDATLKRVEKKLKKFGSIKRILGLWEARNRLSAVYVKFESATSKRNAIEGSGFMYHGYPAEIKDYSGCIFLFYDIN